MLVGLGPGVGVEVGMDDMVGNVGLGEGGVVPVGAGVGDSVGAVVTSGAWQPARIIRMMVNIAKPIRWPLWK